MKKLFKVTNKLIYLGWIALFIINLYFIKIPYAMIVSGSLFSAYFIYLLCGRLFTKKGLKRDIRQSAFRRHNFYGLLLGLAYFNHVIFYSPYIIFLMSLMAIIAVISVASAFIVKYFAIVDSHIETDDTYLTKHSDLIFKIHVTLPRWYKYIPFNLGNLKLVVHYGINGDYFKEHTFFITHGHTFDLDLKFKYKGVFKAGVAQIEIMDALHLTNLIKEYELAEVKVYPKISTVEFKKTIARSGENEERFQLVKQGEKFDARPYNSGDSLKRLNWKLLSRQNELYVKDSELASFQGSRLIFFDNRKVYDDNKQQYLDERLTETLVSMINVFISNGEKYELYYFTTEDKLKKTNSKKQKFSELYEELSFIPNVDELTPKQMQNIKTLMQKYFLSAEIVIITPLFDEHWRDILHTFSKVRAKLRVINISPEEKRNLNYESQEMSKKLGIPFTKIPILHELDGYEKELLK